MTKLLTNKEGARQINRQTELNYDNQTNKYKDSRQTERQNRKKVCSLAQFIL